VGHITGRARVSRRTFYDLFANREDCLLAVFEDVVGQLERELTDAGLADLPWVERVRTGLWKILCFLDREPMLARVCVVQSARAGQAVLEARERILASLATVLDEGSSENASAREVPALAGEGLIGAAVSIVDKRLRKGDRARLSELQGELMGMLVLPYLGAGAASRERKRPLPQRPASKSSTDSAQAPEQDPLQGVPMRVTHRTARVLEVTSRNPGASNRTIGEGAGIYDQGQISKLLARLEHLDLLQNCSSGQAKGEPNIWRLTALGEKVTQHLTLNTQARRKTR
jgi:AcrR family transcriptional regulator